MEEPKGKKQTKYRFTILATDVVIFTILNNKLQVLLIKMHKKPFEGHWAVPGGLIKITETAEASAKRQLLDKTGVKNVYLEQLFTFSNLNRDPFGRVVSVAYFALIPSGKLKGKKAALGEAQWVAVNDLPPLAYDHADIINYALKRLRSRISYSNIVYSLLPDEFSLTELQKAYETILGRKLDKRNFRRKILKLDLLAKTSKKQQGLASRPAELYRFRAHEPQLIEIL